MFIKIVLYGLLCKNGYLNINNIKEDEYDNLNNLNSIDNKNKIGFLEEFSNIGIFKKENENDQYELLKFNINDLKTKKVIDYFYEPNSKIKITNHFYEDILYEKELKINDLDFDFNKLSLQLLEIDKNIFLINGIIYNNDIYFINLNLNDFNEHSVYYEIYQTDFIGMKSLFITNVNEPKINSNYLLYKDQFLSKKDIIIGIKLNKYQIVELLKNGLDEKFLLSLKIIFKEEIKDIKFIYWAFENEKEYSIFNENDKNELINIINNSELKIQHKIKIKLKVEFKQYFKLDMINLVANLRILSEFYEHIDISIKKEKMFLYMEFNKYKKIKEIFNKKGLK